MVFSIPSEPNVCSCLLLVPDLIPGLLLDLVLEAASRTTIDSCDLSGFSVKGRVTMTS